MQNKETGGAGWQPKLKDKRKFVLIAKVTASKNSKDFIFVKYRTNKPDKIIEFLIRKFGACLYANFFYNTGEKKRMVAGNWSKYKSFNFKF